MTVKLRLAAVQLRSGLDPKENRVAATPLLRQAAASGARLIATPECTTVLDRDPTRLLSKVAAEEADSEILAWRRLAEELGVWLLLGSAVVNAPDGRAFNRSLLVTPSGAIAARYDKINLFEAKLGGAETYREANTFAPGAQAVVVDGPMGARLGLTICYDLRFPTLYAALAQAGAQIIFAPAAFTRPTGEAHWETLIRARAIETGAFVVAPAQGGVHEDGRETWGRTMIAGPWGEVIAKLDHNEPGVLIADLDLDRVIEARAKIPAWSGGGAFSAPA